MLLAKPLLASCSLFRVLRHEIVKVERCCTGHSIWLLLGRRVITKIEVKLILRLACTLSL